MGMVAVQPLLLEKPPAIDLEQGARYFGAKGTIDNSTRLLLQRCAVPLLSVSSPRACWMRVGREELSPLLVGQDIKKHLVNCKEVVLLAVTLGQTTDMQIRRAGLGDIAAGVAADALASALTEQVCDQAEERLRAQFAEEGLYLTGRYSPGYGDFPIQIQPELTRLLDTQRRLGLYVTDTFLMTPRKSVTALLGVSELPVKGFRAGCGHCVLNKKCEFRKRGISCESE